MFRFEYPEYLYLLIIVLPLLIGVFLFGYYRHKKKIEKFASPNLFLRLSPSVSKSRSWIKGGLFILATALLLIAAANPQWGTKREKVKAKSADVFIALDVSNSMLAEDVAPNRLARAKRIAENLIQELKGERIGLILFAGNAYLQMPLTLDYAAAELFVKSANTNQATTQGTNFSEVVHLAERSFDQENKSSNVLIIITDGEDHDNEALEIVQTAGDNGLMLFTVGVGTPDGGFIPMDYGKREDYLRDQNGQPVRTKMNENLLQNLAESCGGVYISYLDHSRLGETVKTRIDRLEKMEREQRSFTEFESYFQYFILAALIVLLIMVILPERMNRWIEKQKWLHV